MQYCANSVIMYGYIKLFDIQYLVVLLFTTARFPAKNASIPFKSYQNCVITNHSKFFMGEA